MEPSRLHRFLHKLEKLTHTDFPFRGDDASRLLPWMMGFLAYLAMLFGVLGMNLDERFTHWREERTASLTIQIIASHGDLENRTQTALAQLRSTPELTGVRLLEHKELQTLLSPWLGDQAGIYDVLPLPAVIEASRTDPSLDADELEERLEKAVRGVVVDDHRDWIEQLASAIRSTRWLVTLLTLGVGAVAVAMVVFATRTELDMHTRTLLLLQSFGAKRAYIARQFQMNALLLTLKGAVPGVILALLSVLALHLVAGQVDTPVASLFALSWGHVLWFFWVLIAASGMAFVAAYSAVNRVLKRRDLL